MQYLIRTALDENLDLRAALQRIREARAFLTFTRADQYPFIEGSGSVSRDRPSKILFPGSDVSNNYALSADLSFELDLWGKLRRATEAAQTVSSMASERPSSFTWATESTSARAAWASVAA